MIFRRTSGLRGGRPAHLALVSCMILAVAGCQPPEAAKTEPSAVVRLEPMSVGGEIAAFYNGRGFKPLWVAGRQVKPEARMLVERIEEAALHGLDPARYDIDQLRRALRADPQDPASIAAAELLFSRAYTSYARDLRQRSHPWPMIYVDESLKPSIPTDGELLTRLAGSDDLAAAANAGFAVNPVYDGLARGFAGYFKRWGGLPQIVLPSGPILQQGSEGQRIALLRRRLGLSAGEAFDDATSAAVRQFQIAHGLASHGKVDALTLAALNRGYRYYERIIQANLERTRALPGGEGRFVLVDTAGARLWLFDKGRIVDTMKVVVGKPAMETPPMAALIRFVALNPYWNVPPDLIRTTVTRQVLQQGVGYVRSQRLQVLSDWSPSARLLDPARVNWRAVASGRKLVQVRQLPGADNMMGRVKFMFPNKMGIYLHDTPNKTLFARSDRRQSSGCVRVEDAARLQRWLFQGAEIRPDGTPEQRVDLPEPVPVFITYLTALPTRQGIQFQDDFYGRDAGGPPEPKLPPRRG